MATDRQTEEVQLVEAAAVLLPLHQFAKWQHLRVAHRISVHEGAILVLWKAKADGTPEVLDSCEVTEVQASFARGLELGLCWREEGTQYVGQRPVEAHPDVFLWCPYHNDVRWLPNPKVPGRSVLRLSLAMKMRSHPAHWVAGDTYLMPVGEFRHKWPAFANTKF